MVVIGLRNIRTKNRKDLNNLLDGKKVWVVYCLEFAARCVTIMMDSDVKFWTVLVNTGQPINITRTTFYIEYTKLIFDQRKTNFIIRIHWVFYVNLNFFAKYRVWMLFLSTHAEFWHELSSQNLKMVGLHFVGYPNPKLLQRIQLPNFDSYCKQLDQLPTHILC